MKVTLAPRTPEEELAFLRAMLRAHNAIRAEHEAAARAMLKAIQALRREHKI